MKDMYSFHVDEKSLDEFYDKVKNAYLNIFNAVGLGKSTYLTVASGGAFPNGVTSSKLYRKLARIPFILKRVIN